MTRTLNAMYDGKVLHPDEPIELKPNTRVASHYRNRRPI